MLSEQSCLTAWSVYRLVGLQIIPILPAAMHFYTSIGVAGFEVVRVMCVAIMIAHDDHTKGVQHIRHVLLPCGIVVLLPARSCDWHAGKVQRRLRFSIRMYTCRTVGTPSVEPQYPHAGIAWPVRSADDSGAFIWAKLGTS